MTEINISIGGHEITGIVDGRSVHLGKLCWGRPAMERGCDILGLYFDSMSEVDRHKMRDAMESIIPTKPDRSIEDKIMSISGVNSARIESDTVHHPGEVHCIVDGGDPEEIAECLYKNVPITVWMLGDIEMQVEDGMCSRPVRFSRPK